MKLVHIVSLGCPKNLVDAEIIAANLITHGFGISQTANSADIFLINTCAFIKAARNEADEWIEKAIAWQKKRAGRIIAVCGCLTQSADYESAREKYPQVNHWIGIENVANVHEILSQKERKTGANEEVSISRTPRYIYSHLTPRLQLTPKHYAYVKISDGCDNKCSYCAIPQIRGVLRSRPPESIIAEVENLVKQNVSEIILIGQDTTSYGKDSGLPPDSIANLIRELDKINGEFKIRLMYSHPAHFPDALVKAYSNSKKLLHYIDLPLQHISDKILRAMGRKHSSEKARDLIARIRKEIPDICLRTSLIVGFPGETDDDFHELLEFIEEIKFDRLGAFTYSPEKGTPAFSMSKQVPQSIASERLRRIMELQSRISLKKNLDLIGKNIEALVDAIKNGKAVGRSYMDAPEIDNTITIESDKKKRLQTGQWTTVKITAAKEYELHGITIF